MKTTNLGNVAVGNFGVKRSKVPINRNIYSSCGFGEVQVGQLLQVDPDTETSFSVENLTFVEPIVAPTYGHASVKYWHYFVAMRDLFNDFDAFLAKTNVRKVGGLFVVNKLPHVKRNLLSTLLLWGCHCTIYKYSKTTNGHHIYETLKPTSLADYVAKQSSFWGTGVGDALGAQLLRRRRLRYPWVSENVSFMGYTDGQGSSSAVNLLGMTAAWIDLRHLIDYSDDSDGGLNFENGSMKIPLANDSLMSFVDCSAMPKSELIGASGLPKEPVIIGAHDYLIEVPNLDSDNQETNVGWAFAFKATAFSKRIAKVLKGAEFQEDFTSTENVSLMPLFAVFKAYYESFGILLYENFENTNCKRLLNDYEQYAGRLYASDFSAGFYTDGAVQDDSWVNSPTFINFIKDIGSLWVTDSQDLASAHTVTPTVTVGQDDALGHIDSDARSDLRDFIRSYIVGGQVADSAVDVPIQGSQTITTPTNDTNLHAWIDRIKHSEVDAQLLQILYISTNHETVAGKRVAQLLELAGYGDWMARQQPRFIGYDEQTIEFSQVQSKADTLKDGTGMILGERGGVGESYKYHKQHTFTNKELGYIITLVAVMPDSGYIQTLSQAWQCVKKYDFFNAQFDGVGEELNSVASIVCGAQCNALSDKITNKVLNVTDKSFGYAPMMTRHKFVNNIVNGMFALNSVRDNYMPYSLDRDIRLGELGVYSIVDNENHTETISTIVTFDPQETPRAGLVWRYPTRYPWLGRLARIFAAIGDRIDDGEKIGVFNALMQGYENFNNEVDGFVLLQTVRGLEWTHKLPITDSYETQEDGNKGGIDTNISKA